MFRMILLKEKLPCESGSFVLWEMLDNNENIKFAHLSLGQITDDILRSAEYKIRILIWLYLLEVFMTTNLIWQVRSSL